MSRYVTHKHGLVIGSDNVFFIIDRAQSDEPALTLPDGLPDFRSGYRAIVSFKGYRFDQINTLNVRVETPARQLVWRTELIQWTTDYTPKGQATMKLPYEREYRHVRGWCEKWLNDNVGPKHDMWDTYTRNPRLDPCLFFKRRSDALKFVRFVDKMLSGIRIGD